MKKIIILLFLCCLSVSCAEKQKTKVILLPEAGGKAGGVTIRNQDAAIMLDKPYTYVDAASETGGFTVQEADPEEIHKTYAALFDAELPIQLDPVDQEPIQRIPIRFTLYFEAGSTTLTEESEKQLALIAAAADERSPGPISIIGHTDTMGKAADNLRLSLERARQVADMLDTHGTRPKTYTLKGYGESHLQISTPDETDEARNRRVEITVH